MAQYAYAKPPPFYYQTFDRKSLQFTSHPVIKQTPTPSSPTETEPPADGDPDSVSDKLENQTEVAETLSSEEPKTGPSLPSL